MLILNYLIEADYQLYSLVHTLPKLVILDWIMSTFSLLGTAGIIWIILAEYLLLRNKNLKWFIATILSLTILCLLVELLFKPFIGRPRPAVISTRVKFPPQDLGSYSKSFPSGHASSSFSMATILSHQENKHTFLLFTLATLISISRIYLGYHYPLDVLVGSFVGITYGKLTTLIFAKSNIVLTKSGPILTSKKTS